MAAGLVRVSLFESPSLKAEFVRVSLLESASLAAEFVRVSHWGRLCLQIGIGKQMIIRAQELCKSRGGRPGLPSLISLRFVWT